MKSYRGKKDMLFLFWGYMLLDNNLLFPTPIYSNRKKGLDLIINPLLTKEDRILKGLYEEENIKKWSEIARIME
jgi:hypothetical protein